MSSSSNIFSYCYFLSFNKNNNNSIFQSLKCQNTNVHCNISFTKLKSHFSKNSSCQAQVQAVCCASDPAYKWTTNITNLYKVSETCPPAITSTSQGKFKTWRKSFRLVAISFEALPTTASVTFINVSYAFRIF